uniref:Uncharacterized protein n=1 Tax=Aegilops tauschii subsp. strangulata TaxID=200361 RepID=A0A453BV17_AEGTS
MEAWKAKQKEKAATALQYIVTELDKEKKSRRRAERAKEKLGAALADAESSLRAASKELERERKCRGKVEKMCGELVRGIGEDRAEVEALKREAEDAQRELEKEREMLHLADEWREQRVQMKLLEARLQFEEKNSALTQLHDELQACLDAKKGQAPEKTDQMQSTRASENGGAASGPGATLLRRGATREWVRRCMDRCRRTDGWMMPARAAPAASTGKRSGRRMMRWRGTGQMGAATECSTLIMMRRGTRRSRISGSRCWLDLDSSCHRAEKLLKVSTASCDVN